MLSPVLFTVYIDDLLHELEKSGVGCYWNQHFVGALCYADDIALLAPSPSALHLMLNTCSQFATTHSLLFNTSKTQLVRFSHSNFLSFDSINATTFSFGGQKLQLSQSVKHLGHILYCNLSDNEDISSIKKDLTRKANCMLHTFSCCDPHTKTTLFCSVCLSLYGSSLWMSSSSELRSLEATFNKYPPEDMVSPSGLSHWNFASSCWDAQYL